MAGAGDVEEAATLIPGPGARAAPASATGAPRDLRLLSSAFLFVFLAYHAAQNLQSTVNTDENLGDISLGVLYTSFTAFSAVGSPVVRWMGSRLALVVGTSGYLLFIAANLVPSWPERKWLQPSPGRLVRHSISVFLELDESRQSSAATVVSNLGLVPSPDASFGSGDGVLGNRHLGRPP